MSGEDFERRVERELAAAARRASASPDAWEQIEARLDEEPAGRSRWWTHGGPALAAAAAAAALVVGVSAVVTGPGVIVRDRAGGPTTPGGERSATPTPWRAVAMGQSVIDDRPDTRVEDVASRDTVVIAAGSVGPATAAVYRSADGGLTWQTIALPGPAGQASSVAATADGFVAGGVQIRQGRANQAVIWRSTDGTSWQRVLSGVPGNVHDVAADGLTVVAVGDRGTGGQRGGGAWRSTDGGQSFTAVEAADDSFSGGAVTFLHEVAVAGGRIVAVGQDPRGSRVGLWTAPADGSFRAVTGSPVTDGPNRALALGAGQGGFRLAREGGEVFRSADGDRWTAIGRLPEPDLGPARSEPEHPVPAVQPHTVRPMLGQWTVIGSIAGSPTAPIVLWRPGAEGWRVGALADSGSGSSVAAAPTPEGLVAVGVEAADQQPPNAVVWRVSPGG